MLPQLLRLPKAKCIETDIFSAKTQQLARYVALGLATYVLTLGCMYLFADHWGLSELPAYAVTQVVVFSLNFFAARYWVFVNSSQGLFWVQVFKFATSSFVFRALNWAIYSLLWVTFDLARNYGVILAMLLLYPIKYWVHKTHVFVGAPEGKAVG